MSETAKRWKNFRDWRQNRKAAKLRHLAETKTLDQAKQSLNEVFGSGS